MALGRPGTHARFLPQKIRVPTDPSGLTSSGMLIGKIRSGEDGTPQIRPRIDLLPKDYLRIGVEDERWHTTLPVMRAVHKASAFALRLPRHKTPPNGTPVFLIDRREPELLRILREWQKRLDDLPLRPAQPVSGAPQLPAPRRAKRMPDMRVMASVPMGRENRTGSGTRLALWLTRRTAEISRPVARKAAWWLPPVVWPDEEAALRRIVAGLWKDGCRNFVCNAPWQRSLFPEELPGESHLIAGPFCNVTNSSALGILAGMGFGAAFASPELPAAEALALPGASPLPLGFVLDGFWPCGISRFGLLGIKPNQPFASPRGELFWSRQYGENVWIYPGWPLDLTAKQDELLRAGYAFFAHMRENPPKELPAARRPGLFNWEGALL
jgi:putative protease